MHLLGAAECVVSSCVFVTIYKYKKYVDVGSAGKVSQLTKILRSDACASYPAWWAM
jgi:hypothetical protein